MSLKNNKDLFDFDNETSSRRFKEKQNIDAGIQKQTNSLLKAVRNKIMIIGTDEAGRGPGAGGVFASAVYFNALDSKLIGKLSALNDSKKLSKKTREELYDIIVANSIHSTVCIEVEEIEKINILNASLKAMKLACENVIQQINASDVIARQKTSPIPKEDTEAIPSRADDFLVLVDGNKLIKDFYSSSVSKPASQAMSEGQISQEFVIKGDSKSASIAAASILAKVSRDRYMQELDAKFPQYNWKKNAGYLTKQHLDAVDEFGITPHHRKTFLRKHFERSKQLELL